MATSFIPLSTALQTAVNPTNYSYNTNTNTTGLSLSGPTNSSLDSLFFGPNKPTSGTTSSSSPSITTASPNTSTTNSGGTGNGTGAMYWWSGKNLNNSLNGTNNTVPTGNGNTNSGITLGGSTNLNNNLPGTLPNDTTTGPTNTTGTTTTGTANTTQTLADLYNGNNYAVNGGTLDFSILSGGANGVTAPTSPGYLNTAAPNLSDMYSKMYQNTFTNPQAYWNEYSQGQGAAMTDAAARAMAKSGHTGLMPTLQTQAYQDYMSNYLPSVRKDLQAGLSYENAGNTTLGNIYGQQLDYNKGLYGSNVTAYGNQVDLDKAKLTAMTAAGNQDTQYQIAKLDNLAKQYDVDSQVMQQVYQTMGNIFPKLSKADKEKFVADLQLALGQGKENASLSSALFS